MPSCTHRVEHSWQNLRFDDEVIVMKLGDFINIPAFKKHRVDWTTPDEPTIRLGVRYGDVE
jgi:cupin 2 domain-containing protein